MRRAFPRQEVNGVERIGGMTENGSHRLFTGIPSAVAAFSTMRCTPADMYGIAGGAGRNSNPAIVNIFYVRWRSGSSFRIRSCVLSRQLGKRYLILDRDAKYSDAYRSVLAREGLQVIRLPPRSPNLNAFAERFVRSIKEECLNRMIFFGQTSLRHAIRQFMAHYHEERNHQGLENRLLRPLCAVREPHAPVKRRQRLGGMLSYYHREAA
jgi:hypothetical protein